MSISNNQDRIFWSNYSFLRKYGTCVGQYMFEGLTRKEGWGNVGQHQATVGLVVYNLGKLMGLSEDNINIGVEKAMVHDIDKKRQGGSINATDKIIQEERQKIGLDAATSSNFSEYPGWGLLGDLLRYGDSSAGQENGRAVIVPWRDRVNSFKVTKVSEGKMGRAMYGGKTTWEKLEEVMVEIEGKLYNRIIEINPGLAEKYGNQTMLTQIVVDMISGELS